MRNTAFIKITAVYGQIDENWEFVRKWSSRKVPITDKMVKNNLLSVKIQPVWTRFYGQMIQKFLFVQSSPNLCVKYFFPGTSCAGDANASMSVHYHP